MVFVCFCIFCVIFFFFFFCSVSIGYFGVAWLLRAGWIGMEREKKKCNWKHRSRFCCRVSQNVPFCIAIEINLWMAGLTLTCACFLPFTTRWKWNVYSFCCSLVDMIITSLPSCRSPCWLVSGDSQVDIKVPVIFSRNTKGYWGETPQLHPHLWCLPGGGRVCSGEWCTVLVPKSDIIHIWNAFTNTCERARG